MDDKYLVLVNSDNMFNSRFIDGVIMIDCGYFLTLESQTLNSFCMLNSYLTHKYDIELGLDCGYVSPENQILGYRDALRKYSRKYVDDNYERPLYTEHHTGLCFDFYIDMHGWYRRNIDNDTLKKIYDAAALFGFILRYPKDKENITRHKYEPNHLRYVGGKHAKDMYDKGLCLEEYVEYVSEHVNQKVK